MRPARQSKSERILNREEAVCKGVVNCKDYKLIRLHMKKFENWAFRKTSEPFQISIVFNLEYMFSIFLVDTTTIFKIKSMTHE